MDPVRFITCLQSDIDQLRQQNGQVIYTANAPGLHIDVNNSRHTIMSVWESFSVPWDRRGLEYNTWSTIAYYIKNGDIENKFQVGDTKTFTLSNGDTYTAQVVSINDGTPTAGQYYPANTVDFINVELLRDKRNYANSYTGDWTKSTLKTYLNTTYYDMLPAELKSVIIPKTHMYTENKTYSSSQNFVESTDNIWVPTPYEMTGGLTTMWCGDSNIYSKYYAIFSQDSDRCKKRLGQSSYDQYFLAAQTDRNASYDVVTVSTHGSLNNVRPPSDYSICCGFRIG